MKFSIVLNALCFVLFTATAILNSVQDKWVLAAVWSFGALCWAAAGVVNYKTLKRRQSCRRPTTR